MNLLCCNYLEDRFYYRIQIVTGNQKACSATAQDVFLTVTGTKSKTDKMSLVSLGLFQRLCALRFFQQGTYDDLIIETDTLTSFGNSCHRFIFVPKPVVTQKLSFCFRLFILEVNNADVLHIPVVIQQSICQPPDPIIMKSNSYHFYVSQMLICIHKYSLYTMGRHKQAEQNSIFQTNTVG